MTDSDISDGYSSHNESYVGVERSLPHFLIKLYELVSDKAIDSTISWVSNRVSGSATTFAVWDEVDFVNNVLPLMSKSDNFDSFVTQLNVYGFKKVSWDRCEYKNEWFQEGKPHLLKHIKRRNNQHSTCDNGKVERMIKDLESESEKLNYEQEELKAYMDKKISNQQKLLQAMAKAIKSTFDHHRWSRMDVTNRGNDTLDLTLNGQRRHNQMSTLCESSVGRDSQILAEEENTN